MTLNHSLTFVQQLNCVCKGDTNLCTSIYYNIQLLMQNQSDPGFQSGSGKDADIWTDYKTAIVKCYGFRQPSQWHDAGHAIVSSHIMIY